MKNRFYIIFLIAVSFIATAKNVYQNTKKIGDELYSYDSEYQKLMPLINNNVNTFHFYLDTKLYKNQYVTFKTKNTVVVFINNKLFRKFINQENIHLSIDSISSTYNFQNSILVTIYSPQKAYQIIETIAIASVKEASETTITSYQIIDRLAFIGRQTAIFTMLLLFILFFAIKRTISPYFFSFIYNPLNIIKESSQEDSNTISRLDLAKMIFVIFDCIIIAFVFNVLRTLTWDVSIYKNTSQTFLYLLGFLLTKYIFIQIIGNIFKISNFSNYQFFQSLRYLLIFSFLLLILYLVFASPFTYFSISGSYIFNILLNTILFLHIIKVSFSLKKIINFRSIYFISYICITELIPMILFLVYYFSRINIGFV